MSAHRLFLTSLVLFGSLLYSVADCHFFLSKKSLVRQPGPISLLDFGQLSCTGEELQNEMSQKLSSIQILRLFAASPPKAFDRSYLERKFTQFAGDQVLHFAGFESVEVEVEREELSKTELESQILNFLNDKLEPGKHQAIEFSQKPPHLTLPPDAQVVIDDQKADRGYLNIEVHHQGRTIHRFFLRFKILESRVALVARDNFATNTVLNPSMFEVKEVQTESHIQLLGVKDLPRMHQYKSKRTLVKGEPVTIRQVNQMDAVKIRQMIKGIFFKNGIRIELPVQSLQRGKIGDFIQVIAPSTNKKFTGQILDERTVYIQF